MLGDSGYDATHRNQLLAKKDVKRRQGNVGECNAVYAWT